MSTNLYKKASALEKGSEIITPDKLHLLNEITHIKDKVNQIYQVKQHKSSKKSQ